jgi:tetratricopeptide (TPR) repeat protein
MEAIDHKVQQKLQEVILLSQELWGDPDRVEENLSKAEEILRILLLTAPDRTLVMTSLAAVLCDRGQYDEALYHLKRAEELGSDDRRLFENIGIVLMNKPGGKKTEALKYFEKASLLKANALSITAYFDPHGH